MSAGPTIPHEFCGSFWSSNVSRKGPSSSSEARVACGTVLRRTDLQRILLQYCIGFALDVASTGGALTATRKSAPSCVQAIRGRRLPLPQCHEQFGHCTFYVSTTVLAHDPPEKRLSPKVSKTLYVLYIIYIIYYVRRGASQLGHCTFSVSTTVT